MLTTIHLMGGGRVEGIQLSRSTYDWLVSVLEDPGNNVLKLWDNANVVMIPVRSISAIGIQGAGRPETLFKDLSITALEFAEQAVDALCEEIDSFHEEHCSSTRPCRCTARQAQWQQELQDVKKGKGTTDG